MIKNVYGEKKLIIYMYVYIYIYIYYGWCVINVCLFILRGENTSIFIQESVKIWYFLLYAFYVLWIISR